MLIESNRWMRRALLAITILGCGSPAATTPDAGPPDAPPDAIPPDPFAGMFDDPSEFPRDNCTPGSLAGFAHSEIWFDAGLRTAVGSTLRTFVPTYLDEVEVPNLHSADDLLVRHSYFNGKSWQLSAVDVCDVDASGKIRGTRVFCFERMGAPDCSFAFPFDALPFRRSAGELDGDHLSLLGEFGAHWPGSTSNVRVDGDVAFLSRFEDGLRIVSIANPAEPVELGHFALAGQEFANDLKLVKAAGRRYAILGSVLGNVVDVTDPANPQLVAQLTFTPHSVFVEGTMLYLVDGSSSRVQIWDVANPRAPIERADWEHPSRDVFPSWHDIFVAGGIAYLSDIGGSGMHVVDFRDPANPVVLGGEAEDLGTFSAWHSPWLTRVGMQTVAINGTEFSEIGIRLLDGDPASPTFLAKLGEWSHVRGSAHNLMAIDSRVYIAHYHDGIRVVDISNVASPTQIAYFNTWPLDNVGAGVGDLGAFGLDLDPARNRIYVADSVRGLIILQGDATVFP